MRQSMPPASPAEFRIGNRIVGHGQPAFVIAEIGINHEGSKQRCLDLIEAAASAGADAVKLQTSDPDENYVPGTVSYELFKTAFLGEEATAQAFACARGLGLEVFTTTGMFTFDWIERLDPGAYKISSSTLGHFPLVRRAARTGRPLIMSTGMAEHPDIAASVAWARQNGAEQLALLQCTSLYPCPPDKLDLAAISDLADRYACLAGFSDHSVGEHAAPLAVAAGARIIEKHFSLDPTRPSYDHAISLDVAGFKRMVAAIRTAEQMLGSATKRLTPDAAVNARNMRRYLVARRRLVAGATLAEPDIGIMRLGPNMVGLTPARYDNLIGLRLRRNVEQWAPLISEDFETPPSGEAV